MTKEEFIPIVRMLKAVYTDQRFIPNEDSIVIWYELLKDLNVSELKAAVAKYMQTEKFPPYPADLRKMLQANYMTPEQAWSYVSDALWACTSRKKAEAEFNNLPIECQKTIGSADAFYAYTQGEWNESVNKALFIKAYKPVVEQMQTESRMSIPLRNALSTAERKEIERRDTN